MAKVRCRAVLAVSRSGASTVAPKPCRVPRHLRLGACAWTGAASAVANFALEAANPVAAANPLAVVVRLAFAEKVVAVLAVGSSFAPARTDWEGQSILPRPC